MNNAVERKAEGKKKFSVAISSDDYQKLIVNTLGDVNRAKRFVAAISSAVGTTPALQECTTNSIITGALLGESLNLSPSPQLGQYYLVPFANKVKGSDGKTVWLRDENGNILKDENGHYKAKTENKATFVLGYKGYIQMAIRSGYYKHINVSEVKQGEFISYNSFTEEFQAEWMQDPFEREKAPTVGYVASFEYLNGFSKLLYWTKEQMIFHADKYSKAFSAETYKKYINGEIPNNELWKVSSHWYSDFDAMAKKTMIRQLISHWGVMSTEMQTVYQQDGATLESDFHGNIIESRYDADEPPVIEVPDMPTEQTAPAKEEPKKIDLNNV